MGVVRFPGLPESNHPHYLWNRQEYVVRMLHQNRIGLGVWEEGGRVIVSGRAADGMNVVAHGAADIICAEFLEGFDSDVTGTGWVYIRLDGSGVYFSRDRPMYNIYLDGWYHPDNHPYGDRAVVFIDGELPQGRRAIVMDSSNSMDEYDTRELPGTLFRHAENFDTANVWELTPGSYRFVVRGARGGNGGNGGQDASNRLAGGTGGQGADGQEIEHFLIIRETISVVGIRGSNGANGGNGSCNWTTSGNNAVVRATGGGGGASGSDSSLVFPNGFTLYAWGGSGGGGGGTSQGSAQNGWNPRWPSNNAEMTNSAISGGGGGGGGFRETANGGSTIGPNSAISAQPASQGGSGGSLTTADVPQGGNGGARAWAGVNLGNGLNGEAGRSHEEGRRRRDGNRSPANHGNVTDGTAGEGSVDASSGCVEIYQIRDFS